MARGRLIPVNGDGRQYRNRGTFASADREPSKRAPTGSLSGSGIARRRPDPRDDAFRSGWPIGQCAEYAESSTRARRPRSR
ncbi:hypothetical protein CA830_03515 [Burkholderia multivorans]|nr:hypothetical protein Bmul_5858 [Burkholderia multivorans ATCC 17616]OXH94124.1 hypothetical protein CA830_03515 [Burkholderia multivorans]